MKDSALDVVNDEQQTFLPKKNENKVDEEKESLDDYLKLLKTSIAEGLAYFLIIMFIYFSAGDHTKFIFAFWSIFMVFGNVSGAHVNPIVSLGLWIYKGDMFKIRNILKLVSYILFQLLGGILAAIISYHTYKKKAVYVKAGADDTPEDILWCEGVFAGTFVFVCLFITCTATRPSDKNYVNLTLLSVWLYLIINAGSDISGGCYNPTVYVVLNGLAYYTNTDPKAFDNYEIYILAPMVGAVVFTILFKYVFKPYYISKNRIVISEEDD
jgi:glycerol uptake facilitator-like aquaporin